ncbi:MAG: FkbM family methyltransferase [Prosthecobacter sp.]|jgi:FkbM family methyltransferase|uniref:FkbM family methyltransferase n=1 Tax=Prosthecobacter sp. TaxID=1965333 RepID=UPI0019EFBF95|nr:FkbM family methyltransferase [Prosthecobacter sp.]MBE2286421.1 FkbM family methyltransferase [Prosthecobacter sp.]
MTKADDATLCLPRATKRERLAGIVRPWLESVGIDWLSRPGLHGLDVRLAALLPQRNGFFVEAGANDGFRQSNTYYLERFRGWKGVLIEPFPHLADRCRQLRRRSITVACALGGPAAAGTTVRLRHAGLMSHVEGALGSDEMELNRARQGQMTQGMIWHDWVIKAPVRTLTEVLDEAGAPSKFDLLSLDVEGFEVEVLRGLDLVRYLPGAICVEVRHENRPAVRKLLENHYQPELVLTSHAGHADCYFTAKTVS